MPIERPSAAIRFWKTRAYHSWSNMIGRCYNERNPDYPNYGGRGVRVCDRWRKAVNFIEDMGPREKGWSLEREDVNGDYEPGNCRWIPLREQSKNRRKWQHSEAGLAALSHWQGKHLTQAHKDKISNSMRTFRAQEG